MKKGLGGNVKPRKGNCYLFYVVVKIYNNDSQSSHSLRIAL
jgi:hypothetical protein